MRATERFADSMTPELDIVIPVYNEGRNIVPVLAGLSRAVATPARVLICYDDEHDDTLPAIRAAPQAYAGLPVELVRNASRGAHAAVMTGFARSSAPFVLMFPADDDVNAPMLDRMVELARHHQDGEGRVRLRLCRRVAWKNRAAAWRRGRSRAHGGGGAIHRQCEDG